ncbi:unnamed protein product, partial [Toxocara canis]|uniref:G_PROTEIN_RECEP_F1_2 domain-containing protein n=1 Tax=Toxocara canis TaxID=6265 RepID=A0A183U9Q3_TOXCA
GEWRSTASASAIDISLYFISIGLNFLLQNKKKELCDELYLVSTHLFTAANIHWHILTAYNILLPLLFTIVPMAFLFACIFAKLAVNEAASMIMILFNWQPCAHPFLSLYFITPFRKRILEAIKCCNLKLIHKSVPKAKYLIRKGPAFVCPSNVVHGNA